ncbi:MAG: hypothetical protein JWQ76_1950 [Ramlibacter sp.]|nr:hypothetical protein [Ramlibacter sp.]
MTNEALDRARQISDWLAGTDIALLELEGPGTSLRLRRSGSAYVEEAATPVSASIPPAATLVRTPSVGVLLYTHPQQQAPLAPVGSRVRAGQALALLRVGVLLLPVVAPRAGLVARALVAEGTTVGWGEAVVELLDEEDTWTST